LQLALKVLHLPKTAVITTLQEAMMNRDILQGNWKQAKGEILRQWGKLTNDELDRIEGNRIKLVGLIQERYGVAKDEAEEQLRAWEDRHAA
jgi:uncharacterized protein YjbJ (UPF0337 family)